MTPSADGKRENAVETTGNSSDEPSRRPGRRPSSSRADIEHVALELFERKGFEETTVDDIAAAAGIGRRTVFRYFPSKNDIPWGDFEGSLEVMRAGLADDTSDDDLMTVITRAVLAFNRFEHDELHWLRRRMRLLLGVPALTAHAALKYGEWRLVVAGFAAERCGLDPDDLLPRTLGYAALGAAIAAYESWLDDEESDLAELLAASYDQLRTGFAALTVPSRA
jgi:TetR/AcrR family transcriptional regulator, regulator of mycofactocin system